MFRKIDVIIIVFFIMLSIVLIIKPYSNSAKKIMLVVENESFYIPYKDGYFNLFGKVKDVFGNDHSVYKSMEFEIVEGRIRALHSDCANQICVNTSWIENCGDSIICAPNRVAVIIDCKREDILRK